MPVPAVDPADADTYIRRGLEIMAAVNEDPPVHPDDPRIAGCRPVVFHAAGSDGADARNATAIHPGARISARSTVGEGSLVSPGVQVASHVRIGAHVRLNRGVLVGHNTEIGDVATLGPDGKAKCTLLAEVQALESASLKGEYYESFNVSSKNFLETSSGTRAWIAECRRLLGRCIEAKKVPPAEGS